MVGRSLLAGLVRAVSVVMAGVLAGHRSKVPFAVDQHPVGAFGSCGAYLSLRSRSRAVSEAGCLRRGVDCLHARASEDLVEGANELGVAVPDEEAEPGRAVAEVHQQVAGLPGSPGAVRVGGHAGYLHVPGRYLHDEQDVQAFEEDRAGSEEITGQQSLCLRAQERPPAGVRVGWGWSAPAGAQDRPHGRFADLVSGPGQFAVHPAVSPGRVLLGHPQHQLADLLAGPRPA
jgi:hypothetical protein